MPTPDKNIARTVVSLTVEAYKRLSAATLHPSPSGLVAIRGKNEQGKSSTIESMLDAMGAEKAERPITNGEHAAQVVMKLGDDLVVTKRWTRDAAGKAKPALTIEMDGAKVSSPAGVMKQLRGQIADPVGFMEMAPADQVKTVLRVLGLDEQLEALEAEAELEYVKRRDLGRDADRTEKAAEELAGEIAAAGDIELPPIDELTAALQAAQTHNDRGTTAAMQRAHAERDGKRLAEEIKRTKIELANLEERKGECAEEWKRLNGELQHFEPADVDAIAAQIDQHEEATRLKARAELAAAAAADAKEARAKHLECDERLEAKRAEIQELLESVPFPVDGMTYDSLTKQLMIGGVPIGQASQGQKIKIACAVAMAGKPSIRVMFVRDGSLLDDDNVELLAGIAEEKGWQLWLEQVASENDGSGIWIEDGEAFEPEAE